MTRIAIAYLATLVAFCAIDYVWLGFVAKGYYRSQIGALLLDSPNWLAAAAFYLTYVAGVLVFALLPALDRDDWHRALMTGALFGFFAYATYDLTNLATLKHWTWPIALLDLAWGAVVTAVSAAIGFFVTSAVTGVRWH